MQVKEKEAGEREGEGGRGEETDQLTQDQLILLGVIQNLDELDNIGVVQFLQDGNFSTDVVQWSTDTPRLCSRLRAH